MTRGDIWLVNLDPTVGSEIRKTGQCVVVSPSEMHDHLRTVLVAPRRNPAKTLAVTLRTLLRCSRNEAPQLDLPPHRGRVSNYLAGHTFGGVLQW